MALGTLSRCFCPSFTLVSKPKGQAWGWDGPQGGTGCPGAPACSPSTLSLVPGPQTWCQHIKPGPNTPNLAPTPHPYLQLGDLGAHVPHEIVTQELHSIRPDEFSQRSHLCGDRNGDGDITGGQRG